MNNLMKWAGLLSLLLLIARPSLAQDSTSISVVGSGIVNALVEALAEQDGQEALDIRTVGTATGLDRFCSGNIDLATAIRPMSPAERAICGSNEVAYSELLIGHRIVAFVAHADAPLECLTETQALAILKPSASGVATDWSFAGDEEVDLPLSLILPSDEFLEFAIADELVPGDGLRRDAGEYQDAGDALAKVAETVGALALVRWQESLADLESVALLAYDKGDAGDCALPAAESVEQERYDAAISMFVYVNRERMASNQRVFDMLQFVTDADNQGRLSLLDATPPSAARYEMNARALVDEAALVDASDFQIPGVLTGSVRIVGAASAFDVLNRAATTLTQNSEGLAIDLDFAGQTSGIAALCAREADIALLDAELSESDLAACADGEIFTMTTRLGSQATVLLGNAADEHTRCLTTDQVNTVWGAESADIVTSWSGVDASFPDMGMTLFGLTLLDQSTDILLQTAADVIPPIRRDTEKDFNPLYRAAAVGNVPGALTYLNWGDYQRVIDNQQTNIQLVAVDGGAGCVIPSPTTIENGSYALARQATLLILQESLSDINTQSYLWTLFSADNWLNVEREGFVGLTALELPAVRQELQRWFTEAEAIQAASDETAADETSEQEGTEAGGSG